MEDNYEDLRVGFTMLPGVDLKLWLTLISALALVVVLAIAVMVA